MSWMLGRRGDSTCLEAVTTQQTEAWLEYRQTLGSLTIGTEFTITCCAVLYCIVLVSMVSRLPSGCSWLEFSSGERVVAELASNYRSTTALAGMAGIFWWGRLAGDLYCTNVTSQTCLRRSCRWTTCGDRGWHAWARPFDRWLVVVGVATGKFLEQ